MEVIVKKLGVADLDSCIELIELFGEVFEMKNFTYPGKEYLAKVMSEEKFLVFVAVDGNNRVIGGLTAYVLTQYYSTRPLVYVFDAAVKVDFQRMGIGTKLMQSTIEHCRQLGAEEVFVQADLEDQHALDFYRATGGVPENVVHFYYRLVE